jgi:threonine/homoserine/homoserine lactone efflux protein
MIRAIPASAFLALFFLFVYLAGGYTGFNGLSLLIGLCLLWLGWAIWAHLDREVNTARADYEDARTALAAREVRR